MKWILTLSLIIGAVSLPNAIVAGQETQPPRVLDPAWRIELVASEPEIVTPICIRFDRKGRLFVVESHTHQRSDGYEGPANDRIRLLDDSDSNGTLDRVSTFYEAGKNTMGLLVDNDDWVYVSSRAEIYRIRDSNNDGVAEIRESLLTFKTSADYPHNGIGVMTFAPDGSLVFGIGENFGATYELTGTDGSKQIGSGEGGNLFACTREGKELRRIATGFWNPFGVTYDAPGRLWTVDNDPDASPPCRLLQVVETGDYGFQFRFGRSGTSPLQSWNGTLPGTLPQVGGTGEAPCAVLQYGDRLLVTSWGDNRIEAHQIRDVGGRWESSFETIVQGDTLFRPVDLAIAPDGSIFVSDWVDRSYPVHGKGRIWRLFRDEADCPLKPSIDPNTVFPALTEWEQQAIADRNRNGDLAARLGNPDLSTTQIQSVIAAAEAQAITLDLRSQNPRERLAAAMQQRWKFLCSDDQSGDQLESLFRQWLADPDPRLGQFAVRWIASLSNPRWIPLLREKLTEPGVDSTTANVIFAAISYLELGSSDPRAQRNAFHEMLADLIEDPTTDDAIRLVAMNSLGADAQRPSAESIGAIAEKHKEGELSLAALLLLAERGDEPSMAELKRLAFSGELSPETRSYAIATARWSNEDMASLQSLARRRDAKPDTIEALRVLNQMSRTEQTEDHPAPEDIASWMERTSGEGDADAGYRVFLRSACSQCHAYQGRGSRLGPDLTGIGNTMSRERLLESILSPSKEIAPIYVPWKVLTVDGRLHVGLKAISGGSSSEARYVGSDGKTFTIPLAEIETQSAASESIMPAGLQRTLTTDELRDLLSFLQSSRD